MFPLLFKFKLYYIQLQIYDKKNQTKPLFKKDVGLLNVRQIPF